jgi:hypothetical protein
MSRFNFEAVGSETKDTTEARIEFINKMFRQDRIHIAEEMLTDIKTMAHQILQEHRTEVNGRIVDSLIENIDRAQLNFDLSEYISTGRLAPFNAFTLPDFKIQIGATVVLADTVPEALFFIISHEMGHVVGPTYYFNHETHKSRIPKFEKYTSDYPFDSGLKCISQKVTQPDLKCMASNLAPQGIPAAMRWTLDSIAASITQLEQNPYVDLRSYPVGRIGCQTGQAEEGFADFFAAEVLYRKLNLAGTPKKVSNLLHFQESLGFFCEEAWRESFGGYNYLSPYANMKVRIQEIILSHRKLRELVNISGSSQVCDL